MSQLSVYFIISLIWNSKYENVVIQNVNTAIFVHLAQNINLNNDSDSENNDVSYIFPIDDNLQL